MNSLVPGFREQNDFIPRSLSQIAGVKLDMTNVKTALLSLAFLMAVVFAATAEEEPDWLVPGLGIADVHHTSEYLAKAGSAGVGNDNNTTIDGTDGIANLPASRDVYAIGGSATTAQPPAEETAASSEPSDFSGRWSLAMEEGTTRSLELALRQTGDLVFGKGVMGPSDGEAAGAASSEDLGIESMIDWLNQPASALGTASQAAASGTVVGNGLKLDLVSLESIALYRFDLTLTGDLVSGGYTAYGSDGSTWSGTVTGSRAA